MNRDRVLFLALGGCTLAALVMMAVPQTPTLARVLVGLPLVLLLPGWAARRALFPQVESVAERWGISLALSLALSIVIGFGLHLSPFGFGGPAWVIVTALVTLVFGLIAQRRAGTIDEAVLQPPRPGLRATLLYTLAGVVVVAALGFSQFQARTVPASEVVQLWMLPVAERPSMVRLGVFHNERASAVYTIEVVQNGQMLARWEALAFEPGARWEQELAVPAAGAAPVEARLYRNTTDEPVRSVQVFVSAANPGAP